MEMPRVGTFVCLGALTAAALGLAVGMSACTFLVSFDEPDGGSRGITSSVDASMTSPPSIDADTTPDASPASTANPDSAVPPELDSGPTAALITFPAEEPGVYKGTIGSATVLTSLPCTNPCGTDRDLWKTNPNLWICASATNGDCRTETGVVLHCDGSNADLRAYRCAGECVHIGGYLQDFCDPCGTATADTEGFVCDTNDNSSHDSYRIHCNGSTADRSLTASQFCDAPAQEGSCDPSVQTCACGGEVCQQNSNPPP